MTIDQITRALTGIGAGWAYSSAKHISPNDGFGAKPSYHVHPDSSSPHQDSIVRFYSMQEVMAYVRARKAAARATGESEAIDIMHNFWHL